MQLASVPKFVDMFRIDTAEKYNDPGKFTTLIGYEWTSLVSGNNMHRNVIFRDNGDRVSQVVPMVTQPPSWQ